jgi:hypothetical protein
MDLVTREFVPVYYYNASFAFILLLIITTRDMAGVDYLVAGVFCYVIVACFCCKYIKQSKNDEERLQRGYCFYVLKTPDGHTSVERTNDNDP